MVQLHIPVEGLSGAERARASLQGVLPGTANGGAMAEKESGAAEEQCAAISEKIQALKSELERLREEVSACRSAVARYRRKDDQTDQERAAMKRELRKIKLRVWRLNRNKQ